MNGKIQSFNFDGTVRNFEPCFNGTEPECGEELHTGKTQLFIVIWELHCFPQSYYLREI